MGTFVKLHHYHAEIWLPRPLDDVFAFFSNAENLGVLTPPWVAFEILTKLPIGMRAGTRIDYRIRIHGFPLRWQTEITQWEPGRRFVDEQRRGPYRSWIHEHQFEAVEDGTRMIDDVHYAARGGEWLHRVFIRKDIEKIFDFRRQKMVELFPAARSAIEMVG